MKKSKLTLWLAMPVVTRKHLIVFLKVVIGMLLTFIYVLAQKMIGGNQ